MTCFFHCCSIHLYYTLKIISIYGTIKTLRKVNPMDNKLIVSLNKPQIRVSKPKQHTPSTIQADTLFTFTPKLEFLIPYIKTKMISPRYCVEDISYLKIPKLKKIAFPMKCFCDINMHRLNVHLDWYGYYGLAFSKEWGMSRGIQPIQYINQNSELRNDFTAAFSAALTAPMTRKGSAQEKMKSFLLHELMYYKPYDGKMENRNTGKQKLNVLPMNASGALFLMLLPLGLNKLFMEK